VETSSPLWSRKLRGARRRRYDSNEVARLHRLLILWIRAVHRCLHSAGDFVLRLSHRPKASVTRKSACIMSTRFPLSAERVLLAEMLDRCDKPSDQNAALSRTNGVSVSERWPFPASAGSAGRTPSPLFPARAVGPRRALAQRKVFVCLTGAFYLLFQDLWNFLAGLGHVSVRFFCLKVSVQALVAS